MANKIEEQKEIDLIAGRIIDEFRKHNTSMPGEWHKIAASKIHSQWSEYFTKKGYETAMEEKDKDMIGFVFFINSNYVKRMNHCSTKTKQIRDENVNRKAIKKSLFK